MDRYTFGDGTVLSVQRAASPLVSDAASMALFFDGTPMIDEGMPGTIRSLQDDGTIGPLTTIYIESIEGSTSRGPTRVASLTDPAMLTRFVDSLQQFLEGRSFLPMAPSRVAVLGHSLGGNAALHVACRRPDLFGAVATGSAALWWPGDELHLSGSEVVAEVLASRRPRLWMQAGKNDRPDLLRCNRDFWARADDAGMDLVHREDDGGHELAAFRTGLGHALLHLLPIPD